MKKVFIAETEKHVLRALLWLLDEQDELVITGGARTAESLLAQVCKQPPDVILMDWNLPSLHPQRLIHTLREYCPDAKLIAISVKPEHENDAKEYELDGFISKQLSAESFIVSLNHIILEQQNGKQSK